MPPLENIEGAALVIAKHGGYQLAGTMLGLLDSKACSHAHIKVAKRLAKEGLVQQTLGFIEYNSRPFLNNPKTMKAIAQRFANNNNFECAIFFAERIQDPLIKYKALKSIAKGYDQVGNLEFSNKFRNLAEALVY